MLLKIKKGGGKGAAPGRILFPPEVAPGRIPPLTIFIIITNLLGDSSRANTPIE